MRILIVDDHTLVRRGVAAVVREFFEDAEVSEAQSSDEALSRLAAERYEIALLDVMLPGPDGLELLKDIKTRWPAVHVIMLTSYDNPSYVKQALSEGADGYMLKDSSPEDLRQAISVAMSGGGNVLSARAIRSLFEPDARGIDDGNGGQKHPERLTQRESDILSLLSEGKSNRQIASSLFLSEKTVKAHLAAVFRKLGVVNRTQAAMAAVGMGLANGGHTIRDVGAGAR